MDALAKARHNGRADLVEDLDRLIRWHSMRYQIVVVERRLSPIWCSATTTLIVGAGKVYFCQSKDKVINREHDIELVTMLDEMDRDLDGIPKQNMEVAARRGNRRTALTWYWATRCKAQLAAKTGARAIGSILDSGR